MDALQTVAVAFLLIALLAALVFWKLRGRAGFLRGVVAGLAIWAALIAAVNAAWRWL